MNILILLLSIAIFAGMVYGSFRLVNKYVDDIDFSDYLAFFAGLVLLFTMSVIVIYWIYSLLNYII